MTSNSLTSIIELIKTTYPLRTEHLLGNLLYRTTLFSLSIYLSIYVCIYLSMYLSVYLYIYISIYLSIYIYIYTYIYIYIYIYTYILFKVNPYLCSETDWEKLDISLCNQWFSLILIRVSQRLLTAKLLTKK